jgi:hypothetical protein
MCQPREVPELPTVKIEKFCFEARHEVFSFLIVFTIKIDEIFLNNLMAEDGCLLMFFYLF